MPEFLFFFFFLLSFCFFKFFQSIFPRVINMIIISRIKHATPHVAKRANQSSRQPGHGFFATGFACGRELGGGLVQVDTLQPILDAKSMFFFSFDSFVHT